MSIARSIYAEYAEKQRKKWLAQLEAARAAKRASISASERPNAKAKQTSAATELNSNHDADRAGSA